MCVFLLTSCAAPQISTFKYLQTEKQEQAWNNHHQQISALQNWAVTGKIGVQTQKDSVSASLRWQQNKDNYLVYLTGPLGQGSVMLEGMPQQVVLTASDGSKLIAADPESLLKQHTRWQLPINQLHYWIKGIPDPALSAKITLNEYGYLARLTQGMWSVVFEEYYTESTVVLPKKITIQSFQFTLKALLKNWSLD